MGLRKLGGFENLDTVDLSRDGEGTVTKFKLLDIRTDVGQFNSSVYTVEMDGKRVQFWGGSVLDRKLAEAQMGDTLVVVYLGKKPAKEKGRQPFKDYDVAVEDPNYDKNDIEASSAKAKKKPF